jgi:hypothetical protein
MADYTQLSKILSGQPIISNILKLHLKFQNDHVPVHCFGGYLPNNLLIRDLGIFAYLHELVTVYWKNQPLSESINQKAFIHLNWHAYGVLKEKDKMKNIYLVLMLCGLMFSTGCYTARTAGNSGKIPPGQAKKGTGSKSAKPYAPGQQKKN